MIIYFLDLFDVKFNNIVLYSLVESESAEEIFKFLSENLTYNKNRKTIISNFKKEYCRSIWKLDFKHQFCNFHVKQKINNDIMDYVRKNKFF